MSDETLTARQRSQCGRFVPVGGIAAKTRHRRTQAPKRALWRRLLHRTPAGDGRVVNVKPKENR